MPGSGSEKQSDRKLQSIGIINALRRGTVPASGLERLAVGIAAEEKAIADQLDYVATGRSDLKFVRGDFGSGKTFFVCRAQEIARSGMFVTSHVVISPDTPLHKLAALYSAVMNGLRTENGEHALKSIIDSWIYRIEERLIESGGDEDEEKLAIATAEEMEKSLIRVSEENSGLAAAVRTYYHANNRGDFAVAQAALGWISGEGTVGRTFKSEAGVRGAVDEGTALPFLRGIARIIVQAGYRGLSIAFDETETAQGSSRPLREKGYVNLRRIVDAVDRNESPYTFFFFTGTPSFFEGPKGIRSLPPLFDRIQTIEDDGFRNPLQTQIILSRFDERRLEEVATRVIEIYGEAYGEVDQSRVNLRFIRAMITKITSRFGGRIDVIPRIFLREFVDLLDKCALYEEYDPMVKYQFEGAKMGDVKEEERAVMEVVW
ncbi:MAG: BREX system ATP-binding protein BrxD [Methanocalculus sp.]|uniref:BREX system ATP-binding protein BrxD n=1 Tax=Methanocalculus sp. TaxID=2004547 RepID=UPI002726C74A|nr:BREX system ATP-binding protein BrxD [Methanocalculus sp.]MDO9538611.1 BREX system ATP-binding protein BrxD [Methanocalculus sp.]